MRPPGRRLDGVEAGALAALAALALAVLGGLVLKVWLGGGVVTARTASWSRTRCSTSTGRARPASMG